ncbi:MAG: winged helix DNA-binding domain-containing protein [Thermoleophilia bacterium]
MTPGRPPVLTDRALNRATLARQLLLERHALPLTEALERVLGLQAQEPLEPYAGLWSRLAGFVPGALAGALEDRSVARLLLMRRTVHLVSAADAHGLRALHHGMLMDRALGVDRRRLPGIEAGPLWEAVAPLLAEPRRLPEVAAAVEDRWPLATRDALVQAIAVLVPVLQVPPRGVWGRPQPQPSHVAVESWLGPAPGPAPAPEDLVLRYLRAFGPATAADIRAWSGLSGLNGPLERLRPRLRSFRDAAGRELLDVEDGPLPDPGTPAPVRFLPAFDNAVLGFRHRGRMIDEAYRALSVDATRFVLVDGRVAATWRWTRPERGAPAAVTVEPLRRLRREESAAVRAEARALEAFLNAG